MNIKYSKPELITIEKKKMLSYLKLFLGKSFSVACLGFKSMSPMTMFQTLLTALPILRLRLPPNSYGLTTNNAKPWTMNMTDIKKANVKN